MIITCPNCQTRYRVASDALSAAGREVQCAACSRLWYATPTFPVPTAPVPDPEPSRDELTFRADDDTVFTQADEALLDSQLLAAQPSLPAPPSPPTDAAPERKAPQKPSAADREAAYARSEALARRRRGMIAALPMARLRRLLRLSMLGLGIVLLVLAFTFRTEIVRAVPQADGLYRLIGLGTNVVGLDFIEIKTLGTTRDGNSVLIVNAKISNITNHVTYVPSVLVSLVGASDQVLYEWTVTPATRNILPGDVLEIDAQLTGPPEGVEIVRLSFVEGRNRPQSEQNDR